MQPSHRRGLLKQLMGGLAAAGIPFSTARSQAPVTKKVIVAGAGIGGLCCAYELMRRGHEVAVLEASGRAGGHILTVRDGLADGLYADAGAEHFYRPGYDMFWQYLDEFHLPVLPYPRRDNMVRYLGGKPYTEAMLADRGVLKKFELNPKEIDYLASHPWPEFSQLYYGPYLDSFPDEYRPLDGGLNHLDHLSVTDFLEQQGASAAAIRLFGGEASALYSIWFCAIKKRRGMHQFERRVFRIKGGNQSLTDAFARKLGDRLRLSAPLTAIQHGDSGVTVHYSQSGRAKTMDADYLVSCLPLVALRKIPVTPDWPESRGYIVRNLPYDSYGRAILQSRTRFWEKDGVSANREFESAALSSVWRMADEVDTRRGLLIGTAPLGSAEKALAAFRQHYPGPSEDIEQSLAVDWTHDAFASCCLPVAYAPGELPKFWPEVIQPCGRIHFAGVYADNLTWGMEAAVRSANRVAETVHRA
ncbi:MAG TPA: FAD-dependent oxidoreductase [Bryobacteraceae bacterium]|nr:FAD-dependent oxidoreductase [Bryobacteraceae bacterium]